MKQQIYALGIGRYTPVCLELAEACGYEIAGLYHYDNSRTGQMAYGFLILGSFDDLWSRQDLTGKDFVLTMGDAFVRADVFRRILEMHGRCPSLVHPSAIISRYASVATSGVQIGPFSYVQASARVGEDCIVMSHVNISHDAKIGSHCNIAGQCCVSADTIVGDYVRLGIQAKTIPGRECLIGKDSLIGAGSLVTGRIPEHSVVKGSLAEICKPEPLVSVIVTAFNHEKYIKNCLDSIMGQKCDFNFEVLVHDDASTDGTRGILIEYERAHPESVRVFCADVNQSSLGRDPWVDILFPKARGKFLAICDGDDWWTDECKLQRQIEVMRSDSRLAGCAAGAIVVDDCGRVTGDIKQMEDGLHTIRDFFYKGLCYPTSTVVLRNSYMSDIARLTHIMKNRYLTDWTLWIAAHLYGDFQTLAEPMAVYRINPCSLTHKDALARKLGLAKDNFRLIRQVKGILPDEYADIKEYLSDESPLWFMLAKAYKQNGRYLRMSWCLLRSKGRWMRH